MSIPQPQNSPPRHLYPYPPPSREGSSMQLPSMSSLLAGSEEQRLGPERNPPHYSLPPIQPHLNHPIQFSEAIPSPPVHNIYPPEQHSYTSQPQARPVLVPSPRSSILPIQYEAPLAQRRQSKKICPGNDTFKTEPVDVNSSPVLLESRHNEPPVAAQHYQQTSCSRPITSPQPMVSPRESQPRSPSIARLLSGPPSAAQIDPARYTLTVRQQPQSARACGFGERDRRVIDPPPILVLDVERPVGTETYAVHCILWNPALDEDDSTMPVSTERKQQRRLMGTLMASPFYGKDEKNVDTCFFTFPDLSVRTPGTYSLKFSLVVLDLSQMRPGYKAPVMATVKTNAFQVYNAKDFGGMLPSTVLTKSLKAQGCLIPVKKGNSKTTGARGLDNDDDEGDDGEDGDDADDGPPRQGKRAKR